MSYGEFLIEWYNLPWLVAVLVGAASWLSGRWRGIAIGAVAAGVAGLTVNGALHDLDLGPIGSKFPLVAATAVLTGIVASRGLPWLRRKVLPPVTGVTFNQPGLEGREVIVLSERLEPGQLGRARHRDADGVVHVVRVLRVPDDAEERAGGTASGPGTAIRSLRFGARLPLGPFDEKAGAYEIRATR